MHIFKYAHLPGYVQYYGNYRGWLVPRAQAVTLEENIYHAVYFSEVVLYYVVLQSLPLVLPSNS